MGLFSKSSKSNTSNKDLIYKEIKRQIDNQGDPKVITALYLKLFKEVYKVSFTVDKIDQSYNPFLLSILFKGSANRESPIFKRFKEIIEPEFKDKVPGYDAFLAIDKSLQFVFVTVKHFDIDGMINDLEKIKRDYPNMTPDQQKRVNRIFSGK